MHAFIQFVLFIPELVVPIVCYFFCNSQVCIGFYRFASLYIDLLLWAVRDECENVCTY
jgi:hypothetical protein